jgi:PTS system galactitol-specific IIB component
VNKPYRILVACGTAIATSTHVGMKLKELLAERGKDVSIQQCRVAEIPTYMDSVDAIVATAQVPYNVNVPVYNGIPFLTGIGLEEVIDKINAEIERKNAQ